MLEIIAPDPADALVPPNELLELPLAAVLGDAPLSGDGPLTAQIYDLLHRLIVTLRLVPNQAISENDVADCLDVSKTPVREAFIRLAEDGLLDVIPKKGTYVAPISIKKAFEGYFIRISLESACAETIAEKGTREDFAVLGEELAKQEASLRNKDYDTFYLLDNQFHDAIYLVAGQPLTKKLVDAAKAEVDRIKGLKSVYRFCRPEETLLIEHRDIHDAIVSRDKRRVRAEIKRHLTGMNEAIQAIAQEERLWGLVNTINKRTKNRRD